MADPNEIPWFHPSFDEADREAVAQTVERGYVNEGPQVRAFEQRVARHFEVPFAVATPSGTVALALSLMAVGVGPGDRVLIPDITFIGTASAVRLAGGEPVLVDVDPRTFTMDLDHARRRLKAGIKAILPVHLNGRSVPWSDLHAFAQETGLPIVEDAAEALSVRTAGGYLGTLGQAGCFSLAPTKLISCGQGGFVLTQDSALHERLIRLKDHGRLDRSSDTHSETGFNFKVTDMQGALAGSQWGKLASRVDRQLEVDQRYGSLLRGLPGITLPPRLEAGGYLLWPDFVSPRRDEVVAALKVRGITLRPCWPALHTQPSCRSGETFPGATEVASTLCWLPASPSLRDDQIDRIAGSLREVLTRG